MKLKHLLNCTRGMIFETNVDGEIFYSIGGTAFLCVFAGSTFVVTAKHVAKSRAVEDARILLRPGENEFLPFDARSVLKTESEDSDYADLAIYNVRSDMVKSADFGDHGPIDIGKCASLPDPPSLRWLVFQGYPTDRTRVDYEKQKIVLSGVALKAEFAGKASMQNIRKLKIVDGELSPTTTSDGLSGSPVFWVDEKRQSSFGFSGVVVRSTWESKLAYYVGADVVQNALAQVARDRS